MTSWKDRQVDMSKYELDDDEPISEEQSRADDRMHNVSRAQLVSRAAAAGMTPMEYMAAGRASAAMPDDRLRYDESRQISSAPGPVDEPLLATLKEQQALAAADPAPEDGEVTVIGRHGRLSVRHPKDQQIPGSDIRDRMREWLANDQGRSFRAGFDSYFSRTPPASAGEAVPRESKPYVPQGVIDAFPVDGEIVDTPGTAQEETVEDIVDAEVVEE